MPANHELNDPDEIERLKGWTCNEFALSDAEANVPRLLRKVADIIEKLGDIELLDITFCLELEKPDFEARVAVYYSFPESEQVKASSSD